MEIRYLVRYFFERKGKLIHGSIDAERTECGLKINKNWEIIRNEDIHVCEVSCPRCRKIYDKVLEIEGSPQYYKNLPKKSSNREMCQILDGDGNLCGRLAVMEVHAHLDHEIYDYSVRWVVFHVCQKHFDAGSDLFGKIQKVKNG